MVEVVGWVSSAILIVTIGQQVYKQWHEGTSKGVSRWLFIGQIAASVGFVAYSWLKHDWVFVVTNVLILATAIVGQFIFYANKKRARKKA